MSQQRLDCLLLHVSQELPSGQAFIGRMAIGMFALADMLDNKGHPARILHLGLEKVLDTSFSLEDYLEKCDILTVGISLHWHYQSQDSLKIITRIKSYRPEIKTILGGFTASFFADQVMQDFPKVDFIIRGDAELPLLSLLDELSHADPKLTAIPNLSYRKRGQIFHNAQTYVASDKDIDSLNFSNFSLMQNFPVYLKMPPKLLSYSPGELQDYNNLDLCVGRGCPVTCSFCGGSQLSQEVINQRKTVVIRSQDSVLENIREAEAAEVDCLTVSFDPDPTRKFYRELFRRLRKESTSLSMEFECWTVPSAEFIDDFSATFGQGKHTKLTISPETGSERIRKLNKGFFYTNAELLEALDHIKELGIKSHVYFSYPLPFETPDDIKATAELMDRVKKQLGSSGKVFIQDFDFDPASAFYLEPKKFALNKKAGSFKDFYGQTDARKFFPQDNGEDSFKKVYALLAARSLIYDQTVHVQRALDNGQFEEAINRAQEILQLSPFEMDAYRLQGLAYEKTQRSARALELYQKAQKLFPQDGTLQLAIARANFNLGRFQDSLQAGEKVLELGYKEGNIHFLRGCCYEKLNDFESAIQEFMIAETISPDEPAISFALSRCYKRTGRMAEMFNQIEKGMQKSTGKA